MPARKSDQAKLAPVDDATSSTRDSQTGVNIEDLSLPKSIVTRLAKGALPSNTQIQSNAMLGMTKSATLFINYIASQANEIAAASNRKTVNANDVLTALDDSEFVSWRPRLEAELQKYTEIIGQRKEKASAKETDGAPAAKRVKRGKTSPVDKVNTQKNTLGEISQEIEKSHSAIASENVETIEIDDDDDEEEKEVIERELEDDGEEAGEDEEIPETDKEEEDDDDEALSHTVDEALDNSEESD